MKAISQDLRERIVAAYDAGEGTREQIARRFKVSLGMVKKLLQQRKNLGHIGNLYERVGRKPKITDAHLEKLSRLLEKKPDLTLKQMREALDLDCTLPAIHYALKRLRISYKKNRSAPANRNAKT